MAIALQMVNLKQFFLILSWIWRKIIAETLFQLHLIMKMVGVFLILVLTGILPFKFFINSKLKRF